MNAILLNRKNLAMPEIKADTAHQHAVVVSEPGVSGEKPPKPKRVASLDIFRGLTVAVLLSVLLIIFRSYIHNC